MNNTNITFDSYHRRSIRLKGYDYSLPGAYFVTIVCYRREPLLGEISGGHLLLSKNGQTAKSYWEQIPEHHENVILDTYIIMPNHIHGILLIKQPEILGNVGAGYQPARNKNTPLSEMIRNFKTASSTIINKSRNSPGLPVWQRNYYERVIRDEKEFHQITEYINANILNWKTNKENMSQNRT